MALLTFMPYTDHQSILQNSDLRHELAQVLQSNWNKPVPTNLAGDRCIVVNVECRSSRSSRKLSAEYLDGREDYLQRFPTV